MSDTREELRVVKSKDQHGNFYGLRKVWFKSSTGSLQSVDSCDYSAYGETVSDLRTDVTNMSKAINKPIVDISSR
jgi:hypothetical protein